MSISIQFENVRQIFQGSRIYLDTNIVLSLLDPGCQFHKSNVQLIKECQGIGMQFLITEMTKQETVAQLRREEHLIRHAPPIPPSLAGKVVDLIEEPFVRAYYHALLKNPNTTWEYFFARLEEVDSLMRNLYAIEYDPATLENSMRNL